MKKIILAASAAVMLLLGSVSAEAGQKQPQSQAYITSRLYIGDSQVIVRKYPAIEHRQHHFTPPAYYYRHYPVKHQGHGKDQCHPPRKAYKNYWKHNNYRHH